MQQNIKDDVKKIISKVARIEYDQIDDTASLRKELLIDSIQGIQIIALIEEKYSIEIDDVEIFNVENLLEMVAMIKEYMGDS